MNSYAYEFFSFSVKKTSNQRKQATYGRVKHGKRRNTRWE